MDKSVEQVLVDIKDKQIEAIENNRYSLFNSKWAKDKINKAKEKGEYKNLDLFYDFLEGIDQDSEVSLELGNYIEEFINNPDYTVGIHRAPILQPIYESEMFKSIMENGIINNGNAMNGNEKTPSISYTVSILESMVETLPMINGRYKGSTGAFIIVMPSSICDINHDNSEEIYNKENGFYYIKPEYIVGYIDNKNNMELITRDEYLEHIASKTK